MRLVNKFHQEKHLSFLLLSNVVHTYIAMGDYEIKKVKDLNPKVRTILMSAYNFEEEELYQSYMIEAVINSTIEKPVTIQRLCQRVRDELEIYQSINS
jgi:two-component SAPR family response regulator